MAGFTLATTLHRPYGDAVEAVRAALWDQGFGILSEIDLKATLKAKLDVDVASQVILGACRPALANEALAVNPSIAAVLPCNVVVRTIDEATTVVEAFDPEAMMRLADDQALHSVATDAKHRLVAAMAALEGTEGES